MKTEHKIATQEEHIILYSILPDIYIVFYK